MLINLRNALMTGKRLPYDAEVEFIEGDGNAYIATGITPPDNATVEASGLFGFVAGSYGRRFLVSDGNQNVAHYCEITANNTFGGGGVSTSPTLSGGELYQAVMTIAGGTQIDFEINVAGTAYTNGTTSYSSSRFRELLLFRLSASYRGVGQRIGACKIYVNGTLVRDYVPVRKGTTGYLYDRVTRKLFGNAGTGDFVLGQDVVPVEYIESHGTEYINTGYIPNQQTRWELDYQFSTIGSGSNGMFQENPTVRFNIGQGTDRFFNISYGANNALNIASDTLRHLFVADIPNLQWRLDSSSGAFPAPVSTALQYSLRIFCRNSPGGTVYNRHSGRCFASRMYQSGALSQELLSVRVGTEGAMMDVLTRRIYRNAGTGAFTYGNDLKYPIPAE